MRKFYEIMSTHGKVKRVCFVSLRLSSELHIYSHLYFFCVIFTLCELFYIQLECCMRRS